MSVRRLNLRFNLDRAAERRAWEYLQGVTRSKNGVIIQAVNAYKDALTQREREDAFLERLARTVRDELKGAQIMVAQPPPERRRSQSMRRRNRPKTRIRCWNFWMPSDGCRKRPVLAPPAAWSGAKFGTHGKDRA